MRGEDCWSPLLACPLAPTSRLHMPPVSALPSHIATYEFTYYSRNSSLERRELIAYQYAHSILWRGLCHAVSEHQSVFSGVLFKRQQCKSVREHHAICERHTICECESGGEHAANCKCKSISNHCSTGLILNCDEVAIFPSMESVGLCVDVLCMNCITVRKSHWTYSV